MHDLVTTEIGVHLPLWRFVVVFLLVRKRGGGGALHGASREVFVRPGFLVLKNTKVNGAVLRVFFEETEMFGNPLDRDG